MPISSSTIIHFTKRKDALKGILNKGFRVNYCLESVKIATRTVSYACPMVSFCDIPLSQVKDHIGKYGSYGIGLTKNWAKNHGLSPVQYIATGSNHAAHLATVLNSALPRHIEEDHTSLQLASVELRRYIKNYEGDLLSKGKITKNYRFYDEREWRYVPKYNKHHLPIISQKDYETPEQKKIANKKINREILMFHADDIIYIIIKNESQIPEFIDSIRDIKGNRYDERTVDKLNSRILTVAQIRDDF